jgi:hypothetical protein
MDETERCARIAETWYLRLEGLGCSKYQSIRKKAGDAIAALIRSKEVVYALDTETKALSAEQRVSTDRRAEREHEG